MWQQTCAYAPQTHQSEQAKHLKVGTITQANVNVLSLLIIIMKLNL
jgi:hypothetical protein